VSKEGFLNLFGPIVGSSILQGRPFVFPPQASDAVAAVARAFADVVFYDQQLQKRLRMNISLQLPKETAEKVARAAAAAGKDVPAFLQDFVKQSFTEANKPRRTVAEILAPFRAEVVRSGATDAELETIFAAARERAFTSRQQTRR
jgi:hypothetical protein